jgi:hypothetical protein
MYTGYFWLIMRVRGGGGLGVGGIPPPLQIVVKKVRASKLVQKFFTGTLNYIIDDSEKKLFGMPIQACTVRQ